MSTVGLNTATIQKYIREQDKQDQIGGFAFKERVSRPFKGSKQSYHKGLNKVKASVI